MTFVFIGGVGCMPLCRSDPTASNARVPGSGTVLMPAAFNMLMAAASRLVYDDDVEGRRQRLTEVGQNDAQVRRADRVVVVEISGGPNAGLAEVGQNNAQVRRAHGPVQIGVAVDGGLDRDGSCRRS